ncbi:GNAT family N-acetyltransferase [Aliiroseovarius crassostreae]|uniref:GNAT family N-acetyltransferase n=1 Tax=Aliiroseovarius crassostreae TaxID=154981 RepID=UPI003C7CEDEA
MTSVDLTYPAAAQSRIDAIAAALPRITTDRLTLRAPRLADWPVLAPIWTTERATHIGGPFSEDDAWLDFTHICAQWALRGFGGLTITLTETNEVLGMVLLGRELKDPEPELGWLLIESAEGLGYASEAALALRCEGVRLFGAGGFVSYIEESNTRSISLADRIGAVADKARHPIAPEVLVYRHGKKGGAA